MGISRAMPSPTIVGDVVLRLVRVMSFMRVRSAPTASWLWCVGIIALGWSFLILILSGFSCVFLVDTFSVVLFVMFFPPLAVACIFL